MAARGDTVSIPVAMIEFREGGNTIWIHGPSGETVLRIKTFDGFVTSKQCQAGNPFSHGDAVVKGDVQICVASARKRKASQR